MDKTCKSQISRFPYVFLFVSQVLNALGHWLFTVITYTKMWNFYIFCINSYSEDFFILIDSYIASGRSIALLMCTVYSQNWKWTCACVWFSESNFLSDKSLTTRIIMETLFPVYWIGFRVFGFFFFFNSENLLKMSLQRWFWTGRLHWLIPAKWLTSGHSRYSTKQELEKQQVNGLELQQETWRGIWTQSTTSHNYLPNSPALLPARLCPSHPLNYDIANLLVVKLHWIFFKCVFLSGFGELAFQPAGSCKLWRVSPAAATTTQAAPRSSPALLCRGGSPSAPHPVSCRQKAWRARGYHGRCLAPGPSELFLFTMMVAPGSPTRGLSAGLARPLPPPLPPSAALPASTLIPLLPQIPLRPWSPSLPFPRPLLEREYGCRRRGRAGGARSEEARRSSPPRRPRACLAFSTSPPVDSGPRRTHGRETSAGGRLRDLMAERVQTRTHAGPRVAS